MRTNRLLKGLALILALTLSACRWERAEVKKSLDNFKLRQKNALGPYPVAPITVLNERINFIECEKNQFIQKNTQNFCHNLQVLVRTWDTSLPYCLSINGKFSASCKKSLRGKQGGPLLALKGWNKITRSTRKALLGKEFLFASKKPIRGSGKEFNNSTQEQEIVAISLVPQKIHKNTLIRLNISTCFKKTNKENILQADSQCFISPYILGGIVFEKNSSKYWTITGRQEDKKDNSTYLLLEEI